MKGERVIFAHEIDPAHRVRVLASGEVDESLLDALDGYIKLHRKRLGLQRPLPQPSQEPGSGTEPEAEPAATVVEDNKAQVSFFITKSQKVQLRERGYSETDIAKMKPAEAHRILGLQ